MPVTSTRPSSLSSRAAITVTRIVTIVTIAVASATAVAQQTPAVSAAQPLPATKVATWVAKDFRFHTGETMPSVTIAYRTIGDPSGEPVLLKAAPNRARADALLDARLNAPFSGDANDHLYQWGASRDYDPSPLLDRVQAHVLAINSTDDERNRPELGVMERELTKVRHARMLWVQGSPDTAGHGTTASARWWKAEFQAWFQQVPKRAD